MVMQVLLHLPQEQLVEYPASILNALVLSTTIAPRFTASGASSFDILPPALE